MSLPSGWTTATLGEFTIERVEQREPDMTAVPYIEIGSIDRQLKRVGATAIINRNNAPTRARQWVKPGDVLVSLTRPNLNAVAMVTPELADAVASTGFDVLRSQGVLPQWVFNRVRSQEFVTAVCKGVQGVVYPAIRPADVRQHELPIPPLQEQQRIVDAVDSLLTRLDDAVVSLERVQAKLKAYRGSVLKVAIEGRLVPTEASLARAEKRTYEPAEQLLARIVKERRRRWEDAELAKLKAAGKPPNDDKWKAKYKVPTPLGASTLPGLPEGWSWATVEEISTKVVDGVHKKPDYVSSGVPFVTVKNLTAGLGIDFENLKHITVEDHKAFTARANPERGDLLVSKDGTLGVIRAVRTDRVFSIFVSVAMVKPVLISMSDYLELALSSPPVQVQMVPKGSGLQHIHLEDLRRDCVPIPPVAEQARILDAAQRHISVADWEEEAITRNIARLSRFRQAVLKWAFEGKLADQDLADEPAEKLLARVRAERAALAPVKMNGGRTAKGAP